MSNCKCADDNERENNNIDDGNANLKKDGEPFKALSSSHAGQQLLTRERRATGLVIIIMTDMEFVQKFTPLDFQVKNFTPSILLNFNSFSKKKHKK